MIRCLTLLLLLAFPADAQLVAGPWVDRAEERIREHRMADVEVLVLDGQDRPVPGAEVRLIQKKHGFPFGVVLPRDSPELMGRVGDPDRSLWRGLSAVSLAEFSAWPVLQPDGPRVDPAAAVELGWLLGVARERGLRVRLAPLAPGDPADQPPWALGLKGPAREAAARAFQDAVVELAAGRVHAVDLGSAVSAHPWLPSTGLRRLGQAARASAATVGAGGTGPPVWLGLGVREALTLDRGGTVLSEVDRFRAAYVPVDGVTTPLRLTRPVTPTDLERTLRRLEVFRLDAAVAPLTVAVEEQDQPFELEAALVLLFAEPRVREIQFGGVEAGTRQAMFDTAGNPTAGGSGVDFWIAERWWTNEAGVTDALGTARFRVFAGVHGVSAGGAEVPLAVAAGEAGVRVVVSIDQRPRAIAPK